MNRGWERKALAEYLGIAESVLRRVEGGQRCSVPNAKTLADWLGVKVVDILPLPAEQAA